MREGAQCVQFNHLNLNRVDTASGVFIGNNVANGWRSLSKNNQGFGNTSDSLIYNTINIVFDNDHIDTVIQDVQKEQSEAPSLAAAKSQNQVINFQTLNVNALNMNSAINMGENVLSGWRSHGKSNMGIGNVTGTNIFVGNTNRIDDQDIVDSLMEDTNMFRSDPGSKSPSE